jgi:hypothetical protein
MGFFASRWIEKHGAETEKAALTTGTTPAPLPKVKWVRIDPNKSHKTSGLILRQTPAVLTQEGARESKRWHGNEWCETESGQSAS